jgi:general secretion pathway protein D
MRFANLILTAVLTLSLPLSLQARDQVEINFSELSIEDFLKMTSRILDRNILLTQRVAGDVDFVSNGPVYKDEMLQLAVSILSTRGMTIVEEGSYLKVVRLAEAAQENVPVVNQAGEGSLMVTVPIRLEEENVDIVVQKIRHLLSPAAKLVTMKESNSMVISDYPANIKTIQSVIDRIVDRRSVTVEFIPIEHVKVSTVLPLVQQVIKGVLNQRVVDNEVQILKDDASNALIVTGRPHHIGLITDVARRLDTQDDRASPSVRVLPLQNSEATELAELVSGIAEKTSTAGEGQRPSISADEEMNVLIAVGISDDLDSIAQVVQSLDMPRQQVYVQASIVEIIEGVAEQIGLTYGVEGAMANSNGLYTLGTNLTGSIPNEARSAMLSQMQPEGGQMPTQSALAVGVGLNLLSRGNGADVLSEPSILCVNNRESTIYVGETRSILTSETTTSGGIPTRNYARQDIGLTLSVKPRLSTNSRVALSIEAQLEGIAGSDGGDRPTTTKRRVNTHAIVSDGEPVILGGLVKSEEYTNNSRIPYLSAIPFLGRLFQNNQEGVNRTSLVVIVTPYIVERSEDLPQLRERLSRLEAIRQRYVEEIIQTADTDKEEK